MIRCGHSEAYGYGISFYEVAMEEVLYSKVSYIKDTATATRGAKVKDFEKFLTSLDDVMGIRPKIANHSDNLKMLKAKV